MFGPNLNIAIRLGHQFGSGAHRHAVPHLYFDNAPGLSVPTRVCVGHRLGLAVVTDRHYLEPLRLPCQFAAVIKPESCHCPCHKCGATVTCEHASGTATLSTSRWNTSGGMQTKAECTSHERRSQPPGLDTRGTAFLGGIGHTTIYDLIKRGELLKVNIGRRGFITAESLAAYVDRLSQAATA